MLVRFIDVGRNKRTFEVEVVEMREAPGIPTENGLVTALRKSHALMSRDLDVSIDGTSGLCFAGMRPVGRWEVVNAAGA